MDVPSLSVNFNLILHFLMKPWLMIIENGIETKTLLEEQGTCISVEAEISISLHYISTIIDINNTHEVTNNNTFIFGKYFVIYIPRVLESLFFQFGMKHFDFDFSSSKSKEQCMEDGH